MTYAEKLKDPRWQKKRLEVLNRDGFQCRDCGTTEKTLHVHHSLYEKGDPWEIDSRFLLSVCPDCHQDRGDVEADAKRALAYLLPFLRNNPSDGDGSPLRLLKSSLVGLVGFEEVDPAMLPILIDGRAVNKLRCQTA